MAYFGEGDGPIHLTDAKCSATDTRLTECYKILSSIGINGCEHREDAGVICIGKDVAMKLL